MRLLKAILLFLLCCLFYTTNAQDTIYWQPHYKLSWADFKGKPARSSNYKASTSSGISYSYTINGANSSFTSVALFHKKESWAKTNDPGILTHEQGHFDITAIYASRLLSALKKLAQDTVVDEHNVTALAEKMIAEKNATQKKYDFETGFGANASGQKKWNAFIREKLSL